MYRGSDSAGATLAPACRMHFSHQGKPVLIIHLLSAHDFGGWVATWQVRRDWQVLAIRDVSSGLGALLWLDSRGGLFGSTPSKNEVSGQFCMPVRSNLRLLPDLPDAFVAMQSGLIVWIQDYLAGIGSVTCWDRLPARTR